MAYSINPNLPKARAFAMKLLIIDNLPLSIVANRCGVHRSTIWRWKKKWDETNKYVQLTNYGRPSRPSNSKFRLAACSWRVPTITSKPHHHPWAIPDEIIKQILYVRKKLKRCAEVVWHYITTVLKIEISLSSVRRILRRHHCFDGARKPRVRSDNPRRPHVTKPGELVQTDTIHHVDPHSGKRLYFYTVIDLYTRMTHVTMSTILRQGLAVQAVLDAQASFGFNFSMVQSDNGPEYSRYFERQLRSKGIQIRHSRLHRPNDNAHIERFNHTVQTECIGHYWHKSVPLSCQQTKLNKYLDYYNNERVHLSLQLRTPKEMLQSY
jgi:transposase InsO family protein